MGINTNMKKAITNFDSLFEQERMVKSLKVDILKEKDKIVADSLMALYELVINSSTPPHVKVTAANSLLDRYLGKPVQKEEVSQTNYEIRPIIIRETDAPLN